MNVDWIAHLPAPARAAAYFGLQGAIGSHIFQRWQDLQRWEGFSADEVSSAVDLRLTALLATATEKVAHYRSMGLVQSPGESAINFLGRFPILRRETVRQNFADLVIDSLQGEAPSPASRSRRRYDWLVVSTGGTTGAPTSVIHDAHFRDCGRATRLFSQKLCGFPLGTRYFRLWGSEQDLLAQQDSLDKRLLRNLLGEVPMNAFRAGDAELRQHHRSMIAQPQIRHLMAYIDAAASLAMFIQDNKLQPPRLRTIMGCAGTVTSEWRSLLEQTFQARVFDKYGSRECADIACECSEHSGLHVYSPNVFVEVVDEAGDRCPPGKEGRILVTLLTNFSFPLIRYQIGDIGAWSEPEPCPCGRAFPRLAGVKGREDDMLITTDGTLLTSAFVRHFVGVSLNRQLIREWQFEQTGMGKFVFRYIPMQKDGLQENLDKILEGFRLALGKGAEVAMVEVREIPPTSTGKLRWIINNYKPRPTLSD